MAFTVALLAAETSNLNREIILFVVFLVKVPAVICVLSPSVTAGSVAIIVCVPQALLLPDFVPLAKVIFVLLIDDIMIVLPTVAAGFISAVIQK